VLGIPSGNVLQFASENGHRNSEFSIFPMKNGGSFHNYVKLPECISQVAHAWIVDMLNTDEYSISPKKTG